jgi:hypothetical protein
MQQQQQQQLPPETYAISDGDKVEIRELGRKVLEFIESETKDRETLPIKIVVGAFEYVMQTHQQRRDLIANDFIVARETVKKNGLDVHVAEPFAATLPEGAPKEPNAIGLVYKRGEDGNPGEELGRFDVDGNPGDRELMKSNKEKIDAIVEKKRLKKEDVMVTFVSPQQLEEMDVEMGRDRDVEQAAVKPGEATHVSPTGEAEPILSDIQPEDLQGGSDTRGEGGVPA